MDPELLAQQRREAKTNDERELAARSETIDNPPEFDTKEDEKRWWEGKLAEAKGLEERRAAAVADLPRHEAMVDKADNPTKSRALFEKKKARLEQQLEQARQRVAKIESKMQGL